MTFIAQTGHQYTSSHDGRNDLRRHLQCCARNETIFVPNWTSGQTRNIGGRNALFCVCASLVCTGLHRLVVSVWGRFHRRDIDDRPACLRRSVHFRCVRPPWRGREMGVDANFTVIHGCERRAHVLISPASRQRPPMSHRLTKRCTVLMMSHITWCHQDSVTVYLKITFGMEWVSQLKGTALQWHCTHFTASPLLHWTSPHCTHYTALFHSTAMYSLNSTTTTPLHFIGLRLLHFTVLCFPTQFTNTACHCSLLHGAVLYTALYFTALHQHCISLHGQQCALFNSAQYFVDCAVLSVPLYFTRLHHASMYSTVFHCTVHCSTLHFTGTSLYSTLLHGAVHYTILHIIMYFTALHSLPREGTHKHMHCDYN